MDASEPRIAGLAPLAPVIGMFSSVLQRIHPVLRSLGRDGIAHAILGIEPVGRRRLETAAERDQQVGGNVALREPGQLRLGPVHINAQMRFVEGLLDAQVGRARNHLDSAQQFVGELAIAPAGCIRSPECRSEPEDRSSESGSRCPPEERKNPRREIASRSFRRKSWTYSSVGRWSLIQSDQNVGVRGPGRAPSCCTRD